MKFRLLEGEDLKETFKDDVAIEVFQDREGVAKHFEIFKEGEGMSCKAL